MDNDINNMIVKNLVAVRQKSNIQLDKMASFLGLSLENYEKIEKGEHVISADMLDKLDCLFLVNLEQGLDVELLNIQDMRNFTINEMKNICAINRIIRNQVEMDNWLHM